MNRTRALTGLVALMLAAAMTSPATGSGPEEIGAEFMFDGVPVRFVDTITNRYLPLIPGTRFFYEGFTGRTPTSDVMFVTYNTRKVVGVTCTVVRDQAFENGVLKELTFDYYAQDSQGNVWYFGEDSRDLDEEGNVVSTHGSWEAGVNGARPGIIMKARPEPGDRYHQELAFGVAEDEAQVHNIKPGCVPFGCFDELLAINEFTRLVPDVLDRKFYAKGVGFVAGQTIRGGEDYLALVRITTVPPPGEP